MDSDPARREARLLMIANDFPPIGGSGVQRSLYFAKYLRELGWLPVVLTVKDVAFPAKDPALLDELPPAVQVIRTESLELRRLLWLAQTFLRRSRRSEDGAASEPPPSMAVSARRRELGRMLRRWLLIPDDRVLWAPFAVPKALRIVKEYGIRVVFATAPCYTSGVIGLIVSHLTGAALVLDLRDPWTRDPYLPSPTRFHAWINAKLEAATIAGASRVVVISKSMLECFTQTYPLSAEKFVTITNGYDAGELAAVTPVDTKGRFVVVYSGSLYAHHRAALSAFLAAWSELCRADAEYQREAELWLVGRSDPEIQTELGRWPKVRTRVVGYRPHREAMGYLKAASVLLLLIKNLDPMQDLITIPGKLFEYVGAGAPVLMLGPEGDAADIVRGAGGAVHHEDDLEGLKHFLAETFKHRETGRIRPVDRSHQIAFDRRNLTARLAMELERAQNREQPGV